MIRDARNFTHDDTDILAAFSHLDVQQTLDGQAVAEVVDQGGDIVEPIRIGNDIIVRASLGFFLESPVQITDLDVYP